MYGFAHSGYWLDVGNPDVYLRANLELLGGAIPARLPDGMAAGWPRNCRRPRRRRCDAGAPALLGAGTSVAAHAEWLETT